MGQIETKMDAKDWMAWLADFKKKPRVLTQADNLALRDALVDFRVVADYFFQKTLNPLFGNIANYVLRTYKVEWKTTDVMTCVYLTLYDEGRWTRLNAYTGGNSIFSWISMIASQAIHAELRLFGYIKEDLTPTLKNSNLTLKSMKNPDEIELVLSLVEHPVLHELLYHCYVERVSDAEIMALMNMDAELFHENKKVAEIMLKEQLLATKLFFYQRDNGQIVNLVSLAISSKCLQITTDEEDFANAENTLIEEEDFSELHEALEQFYPLMSFHDQWYQFVLDSSKELKLKGKQLMVFEERFIKKTPPAEVAASLGRTNLYVNNMFHKQLKALQVLLEHKCKQLL